MRDVIAELEKWIKLGKTIGIATNVRKNGTSLRPLGAKMAMTTEMQICGSVTGGCIEGMVYETAQSVIETKIPLLVNYGVASDENPWDVGLSCGGSLDVFVEAFASDSWQEVFPFVLECIKENHLAAVVTVIDGPGKGSKLMVLGDGRTIGSLGNLGLDEQVQLWALEKMEVLESTWSNFTVDGEVVEVFVDVIEPVARLVVIGAVHIAIPLVTLAKALGFYTIIIDPRTAFATNERFPYVDELLTGWPADELKKLRIDEGTYVAALSHDEKLDNPALAVALKSPARYVGVLGTKKRIPERMQELQRLGVTKEQLERLRAPIGLNVGAILPEEIALSILAEMVSAKHGLKKD